MDKFAYGMGKSEIKSYFKSVHRTTLLSLESRSFILNTLKDVVTLLLFFVMELKRIRVT